MMLSSDLPCGGLPLIPMLARRFVASAAADDEDAHAEAFEGEGRRLLPLCLFHASRPLFMT